jgi:hypothetical protein
MGHATTVIILKIKLMILVLRLSTFPLNLYYADSHSWREISASARMSFIRVTPISPS